MNDWVAKLDRLYPNLRSCWTRCLFCGRPSSEIHHIVHRNNLLLRFDLNNLIPLCHDCHSLVHLKNLELYLPPARWLYLEQMKQIQFQDYLIAHNLTREEFFKQKEKELKEQLNERHIQRLR